MHRSMAILRAWLLAILLATISASTTTISTTASIPTTSTTISTTTGIPRINTTTSSYVTTTVMVTNGTTTEYVRTSDSSRPEKTSVATDAPSAEVTSKSKLIDYARPFTNVKDILLQEIQTLDKDANDDKIQEEVAETFKAEAQRDRFANLRSRTAVKSDQSSTTAKAKVAAEEEELKKFIEVPYDDNVSDEYDEDEEQDDDDDDDEDEDTNQDDELEDDEDVMTDCPDYCKCSRQYAAALTATCNKFVKGFEPSIVHLRIENAGQIRLGPRTLLDHNLEQLESITIVDTRIVEIDRTAFNGITYLSSVNLTRNNLHDIHPNTFQNNTQLGQLTIAENPLRLDSKHYLLHAPSIAEFDFSSNGLVRLKHTAFAKMPELNYINLRGNRLRKIEIGTFDSLDSLEEIDLSDNFLNELPIDLFDNKGVQILRISGNNLSTLATISAMRLNSLDASRNKIKVIAKDDLDGLLSLDHLHLQSNNLKRIHQHAFSNLEQLTYLDISDNKLSLLTEHHLRANPRLQVLLLNDNPALQTLPVFKTSGLEYDTFSVYRFECANCGLNSIQPGTFDEMPALTRLNLARNLLSGLPDGLLDHLSSLRELDLSNNLIVNLQPDMFRGATSLSKVILANNPLKTLQVTPFLKLPGLVKLDVSRCNLERVWSEARVPLTTLRSLSVRGNLLRRITVEELRAMPKIVGLDLSRNPLDCDDEFNEAIQWLTDHGVMPRETPRFFNDFFDIGDSDSTGISQWTDLAKTVCDGIADGPPPRLAPGKRKHPKDMFLGFDMPEDSDSLMNELDKDETFLKMDIDHGMRQADDPRLLEDQEYDEDLVITTQYHPWHSGALWMGITIMLITLVLLLLAAHVALCLAKKRGRSPVLRRPMILRQGLVDNKNCGLVYKPLQEEIATPHMPKRGSFYSSSTFHYDKIVPESV